jgi:hypothetical protein
MKTIRTLVIAAIAFCALAVTAQTASAQIAVRVGPVEIVAGRPVFYAPINAYPFGVCGYDDYGYAIPCAPPSDYAAYPYWVPGYYNGGIWFPGYYRGFGYNAWRYDYRYAHPGYRGGYAPYRGGYRGGYDGGGYRGNPGGYRGNPGGYRGNPGGYRGGNGGGFHGGGHHGR